LSWRSALLLLAVALLHAGVAEAAPDIERARQLFEEASTLRESGHFEDALIRLRLAISIKDTPGLEYHAGFCEAKLGRYVKAIGHFERAASLIRAGASAPDVVLLLNQAHKSALEQVARLRLVLTKPRAGAVLQIDDQPVTPLAREVLVDPGKHHLRVGAPGHIGEERDITVRAAEDLQLEFALSAANTPASNSGPAQPRHSSVWKTASIGTALGVTVLGLTTGVIGAVGHGNASTSEQAARAGGVTQEARLAAVQHDRQTYATIETVGFVTAALGALTTIALWTLWPTADGVSVSTTRTSEGAYSASLLLTSAF
jgi:hypothetical protein